MPSHAKAAAAENENVESTAASTSFFMISLLEAPLCLPLRALRCQPRPELFVGRCQLPLEDLGQHRLALGIERLRRRTLVARNAFCLLQVVADVTQHPLRILDLAHGIQAGRPLQSATLGR